MAITQIVKVPGIDTSNDFVFIREVVQQATAIQSAAGETISDNQYQTIVNNARNALVKYKEDVAQIDNARLIFSGSGFDVDDLPYRIGSNDFINLEIKLSKQPSASVTVTGTRTDPDITLSPASLTFSTSNWNTAQTLAIVNLADTDTIETASEITLTITGGGFEIIQPIKIPIIALE